jgi:plastocyanin domain-containing protein
MTWLVNFAGLVVIGLIIWWFWLYKPGTTKKTTGAEPIEIIADDGVYTPSRIEVTAGKPVTLRFVRKDPSPCAEKVIFSDLNISGDLEVNEPNDIKFTPQNPGEHEFTCQMGMYRGKLIVV